MADHVRFIIGYTYLLAKEVNLVPTLVGVEEHRFFSLIYMHCNKKVGAMSHRLHPPPRAENPAGAPVFTYSEHM